MAHKIDAKTPRGAASQLLRAIRKIDPEERNSGIYEESNTTVWWEGGPYAWAIIASQRGDIFTERDRYGYLGDIWQNEPTFDAGPRPLSRNWRMEPQNSFSLTFVRKEEDIVRLKRSRKWFLR